MTAPPAALLAAFLLVLPLAPAAGAGHLVPYLGPGVQHFVSVLVVDGEVRQIDLSWGLVCLTEDDPDGDPDGTKLAFECEPTDPALTECLSTEVSVTQVGGGVKAESACEDSPAAECLAAAPTGACSDAGAGGGLPFRCEIFAWHPVGVHQAECVAYF